MHLDTRLLFKYDRKISEVRNINKFKGLKYDISLLFIFHTFVKIKVV